MWGLETLEAYLYSYYIAYLHTERYLITYITATSLMISGHLQSYSRVVTNVLPFIISGFTILTCSTNLFWQTTCYSNKSYRIYYISLFWFHQIHGLRKINFHHVCWCEYQWVYRFLFFIKCNYARSNNVIKIFRRAIKIWQTC